MQMGRLTDEEQAVTRRLRSAVAWAAAKSR